MPKFNVQIARTETTMYFFDDIEADTEKKAEEIAWQRYENQDASGEDKVFGEEFCDYIEEIEEDAVHPSFDPVLKNEV